MSATTLLDRTLVTVAVTAVVLTTTALIRTFRPERPDASGVFAERLDDWRQYAVSGYRDGPNDARVTVVEFADFQCPGCAEFEKDLRVLRTKYPRDVAVVFRHFPLATIHRHARPAAIAAECANQQGRFRPMAAELFTFQDSIGSVPWTWFARRSGIEDSSAFGACLSGSEATKVVAADLADGARLGVTGTPTVLINERKFFMPPSLSVMEMVVEETLRSNR